MAFILRWPSVLVLLVLVGVCLFAGGAAVLVLLNAPVDLSFLDPGQRETLSHVSWIEAGLWLGAGLFFFIAMVRLIRRTQAFWAWLIGFALFGGRWAYAQQANGGLVETVQSVEVQSFTQPEILVSSPEGAETQIVILAVILIVGLLTLAIDAIDRAYWERQAA